MRKRRLVLLAAALLGGAIAAGVSYATIPGTGGVYSACMLKGVGTVRLIDKSLPDSNLMGRCKPSLESEVSWNQAGQEGPPGPQGEMGAPGPPGADGEGGVSVTSAAEPAGGNCAHGGARFTAVNGVTYACNGAPGAGGWSLGGNAGTNTATDYIGTSDNHPLELRVNGAGALRLEPTAREPNLIGGSPANSAAPGVHGATIGGGGGGGPFANRVAGSLGTVGGGEGNVAGGPAATVAGGVANVASGPNAAVPGGVANTASGAMSFAAGWVARAEHDGAFVWADSATFAGFRSTTDNEFSVRATGGVRFVSGIDGSGSSTAGVSLAPGSGSWSSLSDQALKRDFARVDGRWVLERLAGMPISTWSYKAQQPSIRHLGPTAQDFRRAFGLGVDARHIDSIDSEGVSLAAAKALYELVQVQQREIDALDRRVARLERAQEERR